MRHSGHWRSGCGCGWCSGLLLGVHVCSPCNIGNVIDIFGIWAAACCAGFAQSLKGWTDVDIDGHHCSGGIVTRLH
jgi:hypothetical protein